MTVDRFQRDGCRCFSSAFSEKEFAALVVGVDGGEPASPTRRFVAVAVGSLSLADHTDSPASRQHQTADELFKYYGNEPCEMARRRTRYVTDSVLRVGIELT